MDEHRGCSSGNSFSLTHDALRGKQGYDFLKSLAVEDSTTGKYCLLYMPGPFHIGRSARFSKLYAIEFQSMGVREYSVSTSHFCTYNFGITLGNSNLFKWILFVTTGIGTIDETAISYITRVNTNDFGYDVHFWTSCLQLNLVKSGFCETTKRASDRNINICRTIVLAYTAIDCLVGNVNWSLKIYRIKGVS